jgi:hypothetical protein
METSGFDDQMFGEFQSDSVGVLGPLGAKAMQHHPHHHHYVPHHTIMIGNSNGDINQHQRLPDVHQILPGNSPKDHYKMYDVKIESTTPYSPNGKIDYMNGTAKIESYTSSPGQKLEYTTNGQYSPNGKLIEYGSNHNMEASMMFQQPQPVDGNQQNIINGTNSNFKRKSDENLNNLSGSPPTTINNISPSDASSALPSKKPIDKKKSDPNGVKKKKTR